MVQTKSGANGSSWIQFIKEKSKEYHAQKTQGQEEKQIHPNKKQRLAADGRATDSRGAKTTGR